MYVLHWRTSHISLSHSPLCWIAYITWKPLKLNLLITLPSGLNPPGTRERFPCQMEEEMDGWARQDCVCVCVCLRLCDRGAPCLFHLLAPVTSHHQHTKPPWRRLAVAHSLRPPRRSDSLLRARCRRIRIIGLPPILISPALCLSVSLARTHIHNTPPPPPSLSLLSRGTSVTSILLPPMHRNKVPVPL